MKLAAYLRTNAAENPSKGMIGQETSWLAVCDVNLLFGHVAFVDSACVTGAAIGSVHKVSCGRY